MALIFIACIELRKLKLFFTTHTSYAEMGIVSHHQGAALGDFPLAPACPIEEVTLHGWSTVCPIGEVTRWEPLPF